jgi:alkylhydroperoxidase family enzyme
MSWIRTVKEGEAEGPLRRLYDAAVARAGKVYGIVRLMSSSPPILEASIGLYRALMHGPSALTRRQREMLAVVTSRANDCHY